MIYVYICVWFKGENVGVVERNNKRARRRRSSSSSSSSRRHGDERVSVKARDVIRVIRVLTVVAVQVFTFIVGVQRSADTSAPRLDQLVIICRQSLIIHWV